MIDEQQVLVINTTTPDGQTEIYNQLDTVQDAYIDVLEMYSNKIQEISAHCLAGLVIHSVLFEELKLQLNPFKTNIATHKDYLDLLMVKLFCNLTWSYFFMEVN